MPSERKVRASHLQWLKISDLQSSRMGQRDRRPHWTAWLASNFDLEAMGYPVVNKRDGEYFIIDGQHRVDALRELGFIDDTVQCEVYDDLSEEEEADVFLQRNKRLAVDAYDRFQVAVNAGREAESNIERVLHSHGLYRSHSKKAGVTITASLLRTYERQGIKSLARVIEVVRDAYGLPGFDNAVVDGVALVLHRYGNNIDIERLTQALATEHGGLNGLTGPAEKLRMTVGQPRNQCIAATIVSIYNKGRGGTKLPAWWKE